MSSFWFDVMRKSETYAQHICKPTKKRICKPGRAPLNLVLGGVWGHEAPTEKVKKERTEKQKESLKLAQEKAALKRAEKAKEKREQMQRDKELLEQLKAEKLLTKTMKVEDEDEDEEVDEKPKERKVKKKPAKRVIHVTEISSGEETEEEVEVRIPKKKLTNEELLFQRSMEKMFRYS